MYRYMGNVESVSGGGSVFGPSSSGTISSLGGETLASSTAQRFAKYRERCAPLPQLQRLDDGGILEGWKLQGVLLVIRHGDRGPISHVRSAGINCGVGGGGTDNLVNRWVSLILPKTEINDLKNLILDIAAFCTTRAAPLRVRIICTGTRWDLFMGFPCCRPQNVDVP